MGKLKNLPLHPFLLSFFPPLLLLNDNPLLAGFGDAVLPSLVLLVLAATAFGIFFLLFRDARKAALLVSLIVVISFGYTNLLIAANKLVPGIQQRFVLLFYALVLIAVFFLVRRIKSDLKNVTQAVNLIALFLVLFNFSSALYTKISRGAFEKPKPADLSSFDKSSHTPDIYYFILDGYARADIIDAVHKYDNRPFLDSLRRRGFFVADSSRSNYPHTLGSVSTALNFEYRDAAPADKTAWGKWRNAILHNNAFAILEQHGYHIYTFANGHSFVEIKDNVHRYSSVLNVDDFSKNLLNMTPLLALPMANLAYIPSRKKVLMNPYEQLDALIDEPSPKLVHVHSICPHPPFIFSADGKLKRLGANDSFYDEGWTPREGYAEQVQFINKLVLSAVDAILKKSKTPPIIVMHGDHGSPMVSWSSKKDYYSEELSILCAGYFPGKDSVFYNGITPVNIYRSIFNNYFNASLPLQPDRSYAPDKDKTKFTDVTEAIRREENERRRKGPPPTPWLNKGTNPR